MSSTALQRTQRLLSHLQPNVCGGEEGKTARTLELSLSFQLLKISATVHCLCCIQLQLSLQWNRAAVAQCVLQMNAQSASANI